MDYRELNQYADSCAANADVCAQKLRECGHEGSDIAVLYLRRAYLQIQVDKSLMPFQTVEIIVLPVWGCWAKFGTADQRSVVNSVVAQD